MTQNQQPETRSLSRIDVLLVEFRGKRPGFILALACINTEALGKSLNCILHIFFICKKGSWHFMTSVDPPRAANACYNCYKNENGLHVLSQRKLGRRVIRSLS